MSKMSKKMLSLALAAIMALSLLSGFTAFAADGSEPPLNASSLITTVAPLAPEISEQIVPLGTSMYAITLPSTHNATSIAAGQTAETDIVITGISWYAEPAYNPDAPGTYVFTSVLPQGYHIANGVSLPVIKVTVEDARTAQVGHTVTFNIPSNESGETAFFLSENTPINNTDLLASVTAADETGASIPVIVQDMDGLDMDNPQMRGTYPNLPYSIVYAAVHPVSGEVFTETRELYITLGAGAIMPLTTTGDFSTLKTAGQNGGTYTLTGDITTDETYTSGSYLAGLVVEKNLTIDLNGNNLSITVEDGTHNRTANGIKIASGVTLTIKDSNPGPTNKLSVVNNTNQPTRNDANACINVSTGSGLIIENGRIEASSSTVGACIGGGYEIAGGNITINGGDITVTNRATGAGIGGGRLGAGGNITINGGKITAATSFGGAAIGGGFGGAGGNITINGGKITATTSYGGAGIGGGFEGAGGNITITGGDISATGSTRNAGIGGGLGMYGGDILIFGESTIITAKGDPIAQDIGAGNGGTTGNVFVALAPGNLTLSTPSQTVSNAVSFTADPVSTGTVIATLPAPFSQDVNLLTGLGTATSAKNLSIITTLGNQDHVKFSLAGYDNSPLSKTGTELMTFGTAVTFTIAPTYSILLNQTGTHTFTSTVYGYETQTPLIVTATNTGNQPTGNLTIGLTGTNPGSFAITDNHAAAGIAVSDTATFKVGPITGLNAGTYNAIVTVNGGNGISASFNVIFVVETAAQQTLTLNGLNSSYTYGDSPFDLSTSGGSGTGAVTYVSSDSTVANVQNGMPSSDQAIVTILKAGTFTITSTKAADANNNPASVTSGAVIVNKATPGVSLTHNSAQAGGVLVLVVTVSKVGMGAVPGGMVTFKDGAITLGIAMLNNSGIATFTIGMLDAASHSYTAEYSGETDRYTAASDTVSYEAGKTDQGTLTINDPGSKTYGDTMFNFLTTGGSGTGAVTFSVPTGNTVLTVTPDGTATIIGAGTVTVTALKTGDAMYNETTAMLSITVQRRDIAQAAVTVLGSPHVYTASQLQPVFDVSDGGIAITSGDYTNTYGSNVNAGINVGSVTLTGQGNYIGTTTVSFDIEPLSLTGAAITLAGTSYTYTGAKIMPAVTSVTVGGITILASEYDVSYANNIDVGTATVTVTAKSNSNYCDLASTTFTIATKTNILTGNGLYMLPVYPVTITVMPDFPTTARLSVSQSPDKNNTLTYTITEEMVQQALDMAKEKAKADGRESYGYALEFDFSTDKTINSMNITYAPDALAFLEKEGIKESSVITNAFRFGFDLAAVEELNKQSGDKAVTVSASQHNKFSDAAKKLIGSRPAWDVSISYENDGKMAYISSFGKGAITMGMRYSPVSTEKTGNLAVVYIPDNGKPRILTSSSYVDGWMIWQQSSLSVYGVGYINDAPAFVDTANHWAKDDIDFVASRGLISGTSATEFSPDAAITRADFMVALGKLSGMDVSGYTTSSFTDVASTNDAMPYIEWAVGNGIIQGIGGGYFGPDNKITREEMAAMMVNYAKAISYKIPVSREKVTFDDDLTISTFSKDAVRVIQQAGIITACGNNQFMPHANVTKAEASTALRRFVELVIDEGTARGWTQNDVGLWQYIDTYGKAVARNWLTDGNNKYYFDADGVMVRENWLQIGGTWYYFYADGKLATNTTIDGYAVDADGRRK